MKVSDHEVGVVEMDINGDGGQKQAGQAPYEEQAYKPHCVVHGALHGNRPLVQGGGPVEDLDGSGDCDEKGEEGEDHARVHGLPRGEHVVPPNGPSDKGDCDDRVNHRAVAEDR